MVTSEEHLHLLYSAALSAQVCPDSCGRAAPVFFISDEPEITLGYCLCCEHAAMWPKEKIHHSPVHTDSEVSVCPMNPQAIRSWGLDLCGGFFLDGSAASAASGSTMFQRWPTALWVSTTPTGCFSDAWVRIHEASSVGSAAPAVRLGHPARQTGLSAWTSERLEEPAQCGQTKTKAILSLSNIRISQSLKPRRWR